MPDGTRAPEPPEAPSCGLIDRLLAHGCEFSFFQAVWLLERFCRGRAPVGERGPVSQEALRFRPDVSVAFPSTDLRRVTAQREPGQDEPSYRLDVTFLGLYGVATPLPLHYAIDILRNVDAAEQSVAEESGAATAERTAMPGTGCTPDRDFLDLLHHRLISLFYRSWTKYRHHVTFDMPHRDVVTSYLLWLIGCQPGWDEALLGVQPLRMVRYAGLLTQHPRSASSLEGLLRDYWDGLPVDVEQFVGRWVAIKPADLNNLGLANSSLGENLTVGEQVYDISGAFNIRVGPVDWQTYGQFLPDGPGFGKTRAIVQMYCPDPLAFTVEARLAANQVPEMCLTSNEDSARLGYTSWVRTGELPETSVTFDAPWAVPAGAGVSVAAGA